MFTGSATSSKVRRSGLPSRPIAVDMYTDGRSIPALTMFMEVGTAQALLEQLYEALEREQMEMPAGGDEVSAWRKQNEDSI